jgi:hypothetical protein
MKMISVIVLLTAASPVLCDAEDARPNVVVILADDLGWSDTTLYGTTKFYQTPNVERLAARGMTFTRAYGVSPLGGPGVGDGKFGVAMLQGMPEPKEYPARRVGFRQPSVGSWKNIADS